MQIKNVTATHKKDFRILLENLSFVLEAGDKMAVIGEEGNGKTTLLKLIYQPEKTEEYIEYEGEIITGNARIGYLAQELTEEQKEETVWEFCYKNPEFYEQSPRELAEIARKLGMDTELFYAQEKMGQLSGGEKVKIQLAGIMMQNPEVILLDEPTRNFSPLSNPVIRRNLKEFQGCIISVSHDRKYLEEVCTVIYELTEKGLVKRR